MSRIVSIETFRARFQPNHCLVRLTDADGLTGIGEGFFHAAPIDEYLHSAAFPALAAAGVAAPEDASRVLTSYVGFDGSGVENRARGAIDFALWDLLGKRAGLPVRALLGGGRDAVPVYNTCAGTGYVGSSGRQESANWGLAGHGDLEDLWRFLNEPGLLARELVDRGFRGMKVWPFDTAAERSRGTSIERTELDAGRRILSEIRDAVGNDIEVMLELHGLWLARPAVEIVRAVDEFGLFWIEDPVRGDQVSALRAVREQTDARIAFGETIGSVPRWAALLAEPLLDVATVDPQWVGGLTQARRVASFAEAAGVTFAPHDCTGPVTLVAAAQLTAALPNALIQEMCRAFFHTWYRRLVDGLPELEHGVLRLSDAPGLGLTVLEGLESSEEIVYRRTDAD